VLDSDHPGWFLNGGGNWVNHEYGFGVIDAHKAVLTAQKMKMSLVETSLHFHQTENKCTCPTSVATLGPSYARFPLQNDKKMKLGLTSV
jgi:hypothetical protein